MNTASAGDVDGDGYPELLVGDGFNTIVLFAGGPGGVATTGSFVHRYSGTSAARAGITAAGDANGDGFGDVAVGLLDLGVVDVYLGSSAGLRPTPSIELASPTGTPDGFGAAVASGDFNGDGASDLIVGAPADATSTGTVYVYFGVAGGLASTPSATLVGPYGPNGEFGDVLLMPVVRPLGCQLIWPQTDLFAATLAVDSALQLGGALLFTFGVADLVRARSASARGRRAGRAAAPSMSFTPVLSTSMHGALLTFRLE